MITLEVGSHLEPEKKLRSVRIPAHRDINKSKGSVVQNLFSIGTHVDRPEWFGLLNS
jgi:hypothetical protein